VCQPDGLQLEIFLSEQEREAGKAQLQERIGARKVVIVHPGSAGNTCNLPIDIYAELVERLLGRSEVGIVLSGIASEREKFRADFSRFEGNPRVWNSMGELTLRQLCAIIAQSSALVSVGTGPLHLASALRVATVSPLLQKEGALQSGLGKFGGC
jgi:ADP-heptose:LPS heptosyltransferase